MAQEKTTKTQIKTSAEYFKKEFKQEIAENIELANRKTGFANIDEKQIFNAGLYVVGATPACGKTTFCWQLLNSQLKMEKVVYTAVMKCRGWNCTVSQYQANFFKKSGKRH